MRRSSASRARPCSGNTTDMRFLVIGLGSMGKRRIRNLFANDEKDVVGFDVSADRRKEAEEKHGIKTVPHIIAVASNEYDAMLI